MSAAKNKISLTVTVPTGDRAALYTRMRAGLVMQGLAPAKVNEVMAAFRKTVEEDARRRAH